MVFLYFVTPNVFIFSVEQHSIYVSHAICYRLSVCLSHGFEDRIMKFSPYG